MKKQRTEAQREASRNNGRKSKGPTTPEGKAKIRFNAVKHGFSSQFAVIKGEHKEFYLELLDQLFAEFGPETTSEAFAIEEFAIYTWRIRRANYYLSVLSSGNMLPHYPSATIEGMQKEDRHLQRMSRTALQKFWDIRANRESDPDNPPIPAGPHFLDRIREIRAEIEAAKAARAAAESKPEVTAAPVAERWVFSEESANLLVPPCARAA